MDFDFHRSFLAEAIALIDQKLDELDLEVQASDDPDAFGVLDSLEYAVGFGFVACQEYINVTTSWYNVPKIEALKAGPFHRSGKSFADCVNAAANYWKHSSAWKGDAREEFTKEPIDALGVDPDADYVVINVLHALLSPLPNRFRSLIPFLAQWADEICAMKGDLT